MSDRTWPHNPGCELVVWAGRQPCSCPDEPPWSMGDPHMSVCTGPDGQPFVTFPTHANVDAIKALAARGDKLTLRNESGDELMITTPELYALILAWERDLLRDWYSRERGR